MIKTTTPPMTAFDIYQQQRRDHWDAVAAEFSQITGGRAYQRRLAEVLSFAHPHRKPGAGNRLRGG